MSEPTSDDPADSCLEWRDGILVYTGEVSPNIDICELIELLREERMLHLIFGSPNREPGDDWEKP